MSSNTRHSNKTSQKCQLRRVMMVHATFVKPNVKLRSADGRIAISIYLLKSSPNVRLCSIDGRVTLSTNWLKLSPNVRLCSTGQTHHHVCKQVPRCRRITEMSKAQANIQRNRRAAHPRPWNKRDMSCAHNGLRENT